MDLLGYNLAYLLRLRQVAAHEDLPPVWKELTGALNCQYLTTLQRSLEDTAWRLSVRAPIITTSGLLKLALALGFLLEHRDDLGLGLHQFVLGQNTSATQKVLKARSDQYQIIAGGAAAPSIAGTATLTAPDSVSLPATLAIALGGGHTQMRVVLVTLFWKDYSTTLAMKEANVEIMEKETKLEEYNPCDRG